MLNKLTTNLLAVLACLFATIACFAQDKKLTGKVVDEIGSPLAGASVSIKNPASLLLDIVPLGLKKVDFARLINDLNI